MQFYSSISNYADNQKLSSCFEKNKRSTFFKPVIQPKLTINQPNDIHEQEADALAEKVMRITGNENTFFKSVANPVQRKCSHCKGEKKLQMKEESNANNEMTAPPVVHDVINSIGQSLDAGTRD